MDTLFSLTLASGRGGVASATMFADAGQNEGLEHRKEIQMEEREIRGAGSTGV